MTRTLALLACMVSAIAGLRCAMAQSIASQSFRASDAASPELFFAAGGDAPDAELYGDAKRAIEESRWADAVSMFDRVAKARGEHAAAALYWKAYAESKLGQGDKALETCSSLRQQFAGNSWLDDCGALEIEIRASKGQPVEPEPGQSDELKLLALATLLQKDPARARAQIEDIVEGDSSEQLKEAAVFILGRSIPDVTYPQIVRISYLTGDVRIARGAENKKAHRENWETAVTNLPLANGDSLVTGKDGNVEIEFENTSTVYLAPNSVVTCSDLHTTDGVAHSEIGLVSGTLILHLDALRPGETFIVKTPTNDLLTRFPQKADMRISSYLDGMALTLFTNANLYLPDSVKLVMPAGKTLFFDQDHHLAPSDPAKGGEFSAFDAWVAGRHSARLAAIAEEMKDSGLTTPIPGMADMKGQGKFFTCQPYGTCWEPTGASRNPLLASGTANGATSETATRTKGKASVVPAEREFFPCLPGALGNFSTVEGAGSEYDSSPYAWAVCHAGSWIEHGHRYVWVAGRRIHHHCPVHWVKVGKTTAFVPIHPWDIKGHPPLNRERAFVPVKAENGYSLKVTTLDSGRPVASMTSPPREFRNEPAPVLARAKAPHMMTYAVRQPPDASGAKLPVTGPVGVPIRFDHQTQSFSMGRQVMQNGHMATVYTPVGHIGGGSRSGPSTGYSGGGGGGSGGGSHGGTASSSGASRGGSISVSPTSTAANASSASSSSSSHH